MSKTKSFKKVLSILLSLLMIITAMPFAGVTAFSADNAEVTVMHYTFDNTLADSNGANQLTIMGWPNDRVSPGDWEYTNGAFHHGDGGCYGTVSGLKGLSQWKLTYQGYSATDIDESKKDNSCEIGLGTTENSTDAIRISNYGQIYINNVSQNSRGDLLSTSNTIVIEYNNGSLSVSINGNKTNYNVNSYKNLFENIVSMHSGVNSETDGNSVGRVGSYNHYIYDIVATTYISDIETALNNLIKKYETMMDGSVYTNMAPAYNAYVKANEAVKYACENNNPSKLSSAYEELFYAINQMKKTTEPSYNAVSPAFPKTANIPSSYYSNIIYYSTGVSDKSDMVELYSYSYKSGWITYTRYFDGKMHMNQTVVIVLDGKNNPKIPITAELQRRNKQSDNGKFKLVGIGINSNYADKWALTGIWKGDTSTSWNGFSTSESVKINNKTEWNDSYLYDFGASGSSQRISISNSLEYRGSGNTTDYYDHLTGANQIEFDVYAQPNYNNPSSYSKLSTFYSTAENIYILNFKPVLEGYNAKKKYLSKAQEYKYGGLSSVYAALDSAINLNLNSYFSNGNNVTGAAKKIKEVVKSLNTAQEPPTPPTTTVISHNENSYELKSTTEPTCSENGSKQYVCKYCGDTKVETIPATGHSYGATTMTESNGTYTWTKTCSKGDDTQTVTVDATAYYAAVAEANASIANEAKYKDTSRNALQYIVNSNTLTFSAENVVTKEQVDTATAAINTANKLKEEGAQGPVLELRPYDITFRVLDNNSGELISESTTRTTTNLYGDTVSLNVNEFNLENKQAVKWTKQGSSESHIAGTTDSITHVVTDSVTINAYVIDTTPQVSENTYVVKVYNRINKIVGYMYVTQGAKLTIDGSTISDGKSSVTLDKTPFYQVQGYRVKGKEIKTGYVVNSDIDIYPVYTAQEQIIIELDKSNFTNIEFSTTKDTQINSHWDQRVIINTTDGSEVTWYVDGVPVAKGSSYTFRATKSMKISAKAYVEISEGASTITYAAFDKENSRARIAVSSLQTKDLVIAKQGLYILTSTKQNDEFTKDDVIKKGKKFVATNKTDTGDQFSFTLNVGATSTVKTFGIVSYVEYENGKKAYSVDYINIQVER